MDCRVYIHRRKRGAIRQSGRGPRSCASLATCHNLAPQMVFGHNTARVGWSGTEARGAGGWSAESPPIGTIRTRRRSPGSRRIAATVPFFPWRSTSIVLSGLSNSHFSLLERPRRLPYVHQAADRRDRSMFPAGIVATHRYQLRSSSEATH